jgi:EmrB/QacA subfamily drug resistance transporter
VRPEDNPHHEHRWTILALIGMAQLMVVLDITIVNIALPSAQEDLGFSNDSRQWIVTAYALAFGSLLLLGGRIGDIFGRKWTFIGGLLGFSIASAIGGAANSFEVLVAARALQGVFGALLAPSALGLLSTTFRDSSERAKAFGIFGAIAGGGSAVGLLLGGILTEWLSWRWCLYVNLAFALPAAIGVLTHIRGREARQPIRLDLPGVMTASGGLFFLVYGLSHAETHGWGAALTVVPLVVSAALLIGFVLVERTARRTLLPLRVLADSNRAGSYASIALAFAGMFGTFLFLTYFLQQTLGYSPLRTGLAFLPVTAGLMISAGVSNTRLVPRFGPRPLVPTGFVIGSVAMGWLAQLSTSSTYAGGVLTPMFLLGVGVGLVFAPSIATATSGIATADAGVGSAMVSTSQQIGGAVGTAVLSTVFSSALARYLTTRQSGPDVQSAAVVHAYASAFLVSACVFVGGAVLSAVLLQPGRLGPPVLSADGSYPGSQVLGVKPGEAPLGDLAPSAVDRE